MPQEPSSRSGWASCAPCSDPCNSFASRSACFSYAATSPGICFNSFSKLSAKDINVDIILQSIGRNGTKDISFTVEKDKMDATIELMQSYVETIGASSVVFDDDVAKVSIVGAGMESHPGVASDMFEALFEANVNIQMISTSEIKISVLIKKEDANKAVAAIHAKFFEQIGQ